MSVSVICLFLCQLGQSARGGGKTNQKVVARLKWGARNLSLYNRVHFNGTDIYLSYISRNCRSKRD